VLANGTNTVHKIKYCFTRLANTLASQLPVKRLLDFFAKEANKLDEELTDLLSKEGQHGHPDEYKLTLILTERMIRPLVGDYRLCAEEYGAGDKSCNLQMGETSVWHGWPDMVAKSESSAAAVMANQETEEEEEEEGGKSVGKVKWQALDNDRTRHQSLAQPMVLATKLLSV
jgi:hypothetical protein